MSLNMSWLKTLVFMTQSKMAAGAKLARDAGNMVKRAIEIAEQQMAQNQNNR